MKEVFPIDAIFDRPKRSYLSSVRRAFPTRIAKSPPARGMWRRRLLKYKVYPLKFKTLNFRYLINTIDRRKSIRLKKRHF